MLVSSIPAKQRAERVASFMVVPEETHAQAGAWRWERDCTPDPRRVLSGSGQLELGPQIGQLSLPLVFEPAAEQTACAPPYREASPDVADDPPDLPGHAQRVQDQ